MDPRNAIELRDVRKHYTVTVRDEEKHGSLLNPAPTKKIQHTVIDGISLDIRKGEVVGIIGRNGSGKT